MCEACDEINRVAQIARANPVPCIVCNEKQVAGIATWIPDKTRRLAVGATEGSAPVFAFWLCTRHLEETLENDRLIKQAVLRESRIGKHFREV